MALPCYRETAPAPAGGRDVHIGIIPLAAERLSADPPVLLWRDGQEVVLSIYNYRGPPKSFCEYRMLAGPFYRGNVRNGFVVAVAPRASVFAAEFMRLVDETTIDDRLDGSLRRITCESAFGKIGLDYDLSRLRQ